MNRTLLQFVMRHADPVGSDTDLLGRYRASGDELAFVSLVKRHGPMVWAVCRHLIPNRADAEDAFQAVFLALAKSARSIRRPDQLSSWLHGAAVRIAGKAKRSYLRRATHEHRTARSEGDSPVSELAWAELLGAVHDEVAKLPRSLRATFVLCELEGADQTAAAAQLGLKVNTLSGQLARARQMLLDRLTKRGVGAGLAVVGTAVSVPPALADKAAGLVGAVPTQVTVAITELAAEITAMKLTKLKLLAAGLMLTCGLTLNGLGLLPKAEGQPQPPQPGAGGPPGGAGLPGKGGPLGPGAAGGLPGGPGSGSPDGGGLGGPGGLAGGPPGSGGPLGGMMGGGEGGSGGMMGGPSGPWAAFEYLFVAKPGTLPDVATVLRNKATQNWEYTGPLDIDPSDPKATRGVEGVTRDTRVVLVFKRSAPTGMAGMGGMGMGDGMMGGQSMGAPGGMMPGGPGMGSAMGQMMPGGPGVSWPGGTSGTGPGGMGGPGGGVRETKVFRLKHKLAEELAGEVLSTYTDARGKKTDRDPVITVDAKGNSLVVTGASNDVTIVGQIITVLDTPPTDQYEVIPLKNAKAEEVAKLLGEVFNGPNGKGNRVAVVAEKTSNAVVVTKASAADLVTIKELLKNVIDVKRTGGQ